jgi:malonate transporter
VVKSTLSAPTFERLLTCAVVTYLSLLLPDFILIACGFLLCRYTALKRPLWEQVEILVYYFLFPALLFHSVSRANLDLSTASTLIGAALCIVGCTTLLSYAIAQLPGVDRHAQAAAAQVGIRFNSFVGLAVATRISPDALLLMAVLIGFCVPLTNIASVWPMARQAQQNVGRQLMRNPLILATATGLACNLLGLRLPVWSEIPLTRIGQAALVMGLLTAGAGMQFGALRQDKAVSLAMLLIRHLCAPLLALLLVMLLRLPPAEALVLMMFSALPTASSCHVLASRMGYNGSYVAALVSISTLLGVASLTLAMALLDNYLA